MRQPPKPPVDDAGGEFRRSPYHVRVAPATDREQALIASLTLAERLEALTTAGARVVERWLRP